MPSIGILAYGSLIADPGHEIVNAATKSDSREIHKVQFETPFAVEYARLSEGRRKAPTLVPVPDDAGDPVNGSIIALNSSVTLQDAKDVLYRRELDHVGDLSLDYDDKEQRKKGNAVVIAEIAGHPEFDILIYALLKPTPALLSMLQDIDLSTMSKAQHLAKAAYSSIDEETFFRCRDGVRYLADAISCGIVTSLTESYRQAILDMAGNAPDLEEARVRLAKQKGLISE